MLYQLDHRIAFPHPSLAEPDGLLAIGGDLSIDRLLLAYEHGIFPWYDDNSPILWYAPPERFVLLPEELKITKSMRQFMKKTTLTTVHDQAFKQVIHECAIANRKGQDGTWITNEMEKAYIELHRQGYAHSVETYDSDGNLVGGLYGIQVGEVFCGESMFAKVSNASKLAFIHLCHSFGFKLIDCQVHTSHLASLGAKFIANTTYYNLLQQQNIQPYAFQKTL